MGEVPPDSGPTPTSKETLAAARVPDLMQLMLDGGSTRSQTI